MNSRLELIKPIVRVGNSAGVLLPREWLNGKARIELVEKPLDIKRDILEILSDYLDEVLGVYLTGSYARGEQTDESDVDVLVITNKSNKTLKSGKYEIILVSREKLERQVKENALPLVPMLVEAKVIINPELLKNCQNLRISSRNLKFHIETTKSALKVAREFLELNKSGKVSDNIVYSLVLRARESYIVDCLNEGKIATTKGFLQLLDKIGAGKEAYLSYLRAKSDKKAVSSVSLDDALKIHTYLENKIKEQERWIKERSS